MKPQVIMNVRLTTVEPILGMEPGDPEIYRKYIASKSPDATTVEEEVRSLGEDAVVEKGKTVFARDPDGNPAFWDYQIRGMFKGACGFLRNVSKSESSKVKAYKKAIDGRIFVRPRMVPISFEGEITDCQRSLRTSSPQGERVGLAISERIPAGATIEFRIGLLEKSDQKVVEEWLDYGHLSGIGQWRNSGMGRFVWELLDDDGHVIGGNKDEEDDW